MDSIFCMVDIVLLTIFEGRLYLVLCRRDKDPHEGAFTIPGGKIEPDADLDDREAALRVLLEKAGIKSPYLEQLRTFAGRFRDQRRWSISIAHYALVPYEVVAGALGDNTKLVPVDEAIVLPFDHNEMVREALERVRIKGRYSSLPCALADEMFTIPELQKIYEIVLGEEQEKKKFRAAIKKMDILEKAPVPRRMTGGAPAEVYRVKKSFRNRLAFLDRGL